MKIQIDTKAKTVSLEGAVNMGEFVNEIKLMLPDWENYTLEINAMINNWSNPVVSNLVSRPHPNPNPYIINSEKSKHVFNILLN